MNTEEIDNARVLTIEQLLESLDHAMSQGDYERVAECSLMIHKIAKAMGTP